ncbi:hypothetical protein NDU88_007380 [Pleurodeles waltl]|uniref:Uncharacterized protein n=1 Tax=Pleurodeles waltl TaxID=8319 RepID=A0AAV7NX79_PLEWA|nr:hypothetical protein NDU88_007380 [Pleurodeles waltl]
MVESQQKLEQVIERFLKTAAEDRQNIHKALTDQAQFQDMAIGTLADIVGQQRGHNTLPSVVLQTYVSREDPDFIFKNYERMAQPVACPQIDGVNIWVLCCRGSFRWPIKHLTPKDSKF